MKHNWLVIAVAMLLLAVGVVAQESKNPLVGNWLCEEDGTKVLIRPNGTLKINDDEFIYKVKGSVISIFNEEAALAFPFALDGDTLTVEYEGRDVVYARVKPGMAAAKPAEASGGGGMMQALVGKWCYMSNLTGTNSYMSSRCFVLNANGTYEYTAESSTSGNYGGTSSQAYDSGRWSATRTTITAHSNSNGTTTYSMELRNHPKTGDPMIVVDGDAYVTAYQRQPW